MAVMADDDWHLVFKVASGGVRNVLDLYTGNETLNMDNLKAQDVRQAFPEHFKSDIVNHWTEVGINQVRMSVFKGGAEKAFFLFDGFGSNKMNWLSKGRLLNSSFTDMKDSNSTTPIKFFSVFGTSAMSSARLFYINSDWTGCSTDTGWLGVIDTNGSRPCLWEKKNITIRPLVFYSPLTEKATFAAVDDDILADSMAVFVKFATNTLACVKMFPPPIRISGNNYFYTTCPFDTTRVTTTGQETITPITDTNLQVKLQELNNELKVNKKNTTRYRRSLTSVYESRMSALAMGSVGAAILAIVALLFVLSDCLNFAGCANRKKQHQII